MPSLFSSRLLNETVLVALGAAGASPGEEAPGAPGAQPASSVVPPISSRHRRTVAAPDHLLTIVGRIFPHVPSARSARLIALIDSIADFCPVGLIDVPLVHIPRGDAQWLEDRRSHHPVAKYRLFRGIERWDHEHFVGQLLHESRVDHLVPGRVQLMVPLGVELVYRGIAVPAL